MWAHIIEQWMSKLLGGEIRYDPRRVKTRWVSASESDRRRFLAILNGARKDRLRQPGA